MDVFSFLESQDTSSPEHGIDKVRLAAILYQNMRNHSSSVQKSNMLFKDNLSPKDQERIELALEKIPEFKAYLYLKEHKVSISSIEAKITNMFS